VESYDAYLHKPVLDAAIDHARRFAKVGVESMGLLVGEAYTHRGRPYVVIEKYLTAGNESTRVSVRFSREALGELAREYMARHRGKVLAGWCHSHPSYGCFLSSTDLATQRRFFPEPWHVAMVVDPLREEGGSPAHRVFKLNHAGYEEAAYAVIEHRG
jgi:proteasome lid subunit RPN8/RPN11